MTATSQRQFGIEIECYLPRGEASSCRTMSGLARLLTEAGIVVSSAGSYTHTVMPGWKIVTDGSLSTGGCEVVSPILSGDDGAEQVRKVCKVLNENGITVNRSCGLHVHVDARNLAFGQVRNVCKMFAKYEQQFDALLPESRRQNRFCSSNLATWGGSLDAAFERLDHCHSVSDLQRANRENRYHKLNLESLSRYGSIEFRMHSGTVDAAKILAWVGMLLGFVDRAATTRRVEKDGAGKMENLLRFASASSRRFYRTRAKLFSGEAARTAAVLRARSATEDSER